MNNGDTITGIVEARKCPACGHSEIGVSTENGDFLPLKPGMTIQISGSKPAKAIEKQGGANLQKDKSETKDLESLRDYGPWVPGPVKGDRSLRLKYGVLIRKDLLQQKMNGEIFKAAYVEKLRGLVEKEVHTPIAVILDQFFTAPHLASGDSREIAMNMWEELEEIRYPAEMAEAWIDNPCEESIENLTRPKSKEDIDDYPVGETEFLRELMQLNLEEFLSLL